MTCIDPKCNKSIFLYTKVQESLPELIRMNMINGLHKHDGKPFYISERLGQTGG